VQFYWAAAGVTSGNLTKFAHDNFLQMQDPDLGWIRNVMRVAGTECDLAPNADPAGVQFAIREWIGDAEGGQLGYFRRKTAERIAHRRATEALSSIGLVASLAALVVLLFVGAGAPEWVRVPLVYGVGCLLLAIGIRQSYGQGHRPSPRSSSSTNSCFAPSATPGAASTRPRPTTSVAACSRSWATQALEEHAEWILMHRQRSIDPRDVVRLS